MTAVQDSAVQASVDRFVAFLERGETEGVFAPNAFCDLTFPHWRTQCEGAEELIRARRTLHPQRSEVIVERVLPAVDGYALKVEERWEDGGQQWYCREGFLVLLDDDGLIREMDLYCTGDWDEARVAEHAAAVTLIRP